MATRSDPAKLELARRARAQFVAQAVQIVAELAPKIRERMLLMVDEAENARDMQDRRDAWLDYQKQQAQWSLGCAKALQNAGESSLDLCWRMPLDDDYAEGLKTNFADVANVAGRAGGAVTAAKFLQRFTAKFAWAHLDIAGTAWKSGAAKGATGRPVALLVDYLLGQVNAPQQKASPATVLPPAKKRKPSA